MHFWLREQIKKNEGCFQGIICDDQAFHIIQVDYHLMIRKYLHLDSIFRLFPNNYGIVSLKTVPQQRTFPPPPSLHSGDALYNSYCRLTVNSRLQVHLSDLQKLVLNNIKKDKKTIELLLQTFANMDPDTIKAKNLKSILQIFSGLQKSEKSLMDNSIIVEMKSRLEILQKGKEENPTEILMQLYMLKPQVKNQHQMPATIGQELISNLNQTAEADLRLQTIVNFLMYLKPLFTLSVNDRKIRLLLLYKVRKGIATYSKDEVCSLAFILNSIFHYDFLEEQLKIVEEIFAKAEESYNLNGKMSIELIEQVCYREQCLSNKHSLSNMLSSIIKSHLSTIKKYNSAEAHQIFELITVVNEKLKKAQSNDDKIVAFILQYVLISGKTKKHNKNINLALQKLISTFFSQSHLQLLIEVLSEIEFKLFPIVFYELANKNVDVRKLIPFVEKPKGDEIVLMAIALNMAKMQSTQKQWLEANINRDLASAPRFIALFQKVLSKSPATHLLKNFDTIFGQKIRLLYKSPLSNAEGLIFIKYFAFSLLNSGVKVDQLLQNLKKVPKAITEAIIEETIKSQQKKYIGKLLFLFKNEQNSWDRTFMNIFILANQYLRQNLLTHDEQTQYWFVLEQSIRFFFNQSEMNETMHEYVHFLATLFRRYNNQYSDFLESGFFSRFLNYSFAAHIQKLRPFPQLRTIITKYIIIYKTRSVNFRQEMTNFNKNQLNYFQLETLNSMLNKKYTPKIDNIDEQTLPIVLYNYNTYQLLKSKQAECMQLIKKSNFRTLCNYLLGIRLDAKQAYPQIACLIIDVLAQKVDFASVNMYPYLRIFVTTGLILTPSCTEFMRRYLVYLTSAPNRADDYNLQVIILSIIKSQRLPKDLTDSFIRQLFGKLNQYREKQIRYFCSKVLLTNYIFAPAQLELICEMAPPNEALTLLDEFLSQSLRQRLLERIMHNDDNSKKVLSRMQIRYLNRLYPQYGKKIVVDTIQPIQFLKAKAGDQEKLIQLATISSAKITPTQYYNHKAFSVRGTIILFVDPLYRNSIHLFSFLERVFKLDFGQNSKISIMFSFPQSYKQVSETVKIRQVFTNEEWRNFFNTTTKPKNPSSETELQDQDKSQDTKQQNKKSRRRRSFFRSSNSQSQIL